MTPRSTTSPVSLVTLGEALIDLVAYERSGAGLAHAERFQRAAGGAPANVAVGAARLGVRSGFVGRVGADPFGDYLVTTLNAAGVDVTRLKRDAQAPTALAFVSLASDGDREFAFYHRGAADTRLQVDDIDEDYLHAAQLLHIGSISLSHEPARSATLHAVQVAEKHGLIRSFDPNIRLSLWANDEEARSAVLALVPRMNIIKVSAEELEFLTGGTDEAAARELLLGAVNLVLVTEGARGVRYFGHSHHLGVGRVGSPVVATVDTTGAGDAFMAALLTAVCQQPEFLVRPSTTAGAEHRHVKRQLEAILRRANAYAALTTTKHGAIPALPSRSELESFVAGLTDTEQA